MEDKTLPEGFVKMVDCCRFCVHNDVMINQHTSGWCYKHEIIVSVFSKCDDYED